MPGEEQAPNELHPNADELAILLHKEEIKAKLSELGTGVSDLVQGVIDSLENFLKKLG